MDSLIIAFDDASWNVSTFLDLESGEVFSITAEIRRELEAVYERLPTEAPSEEEFRTVLVTLLEQHDLPPWMHEVLADADRLERGLGTRFLEVPCLESDEAYQDMVAFLVTVDSPRLRSHVGEAIRGRGAFRRFKDALNQHPAEQRRWHEFKEARMRERVLAWLESEGIEAIDQST
jgi:hypothetical protein